MRSVGDDVKRTRTGERAQTTGSGDARRERWRSHRETRRGELLDAAARALEEHGDGLRVEHVATEAGITKPVLYRHFADKADLFDALSRRGTEILLGRMIPAIKSEKAPVPRIRGSLEAFFSVIAEHPELYRVLARPAGRGNGSEAAEDKEVIAAAIAALLGDHLQALELDSGAAEPWAHAIVGMVQNTAEWWLSRRSMSQARVVEYLTELIWSAIDGVARAHGVVIDPDQPLELSDTTPTVTGVPVHRVEENRGGSG
jgi:AcrR family transcriptional regulator